MKQTDWDILCYEDQRLPLGEPLLEPFFEKQPRLRPPGAGRSYWATFAFDGEDLVVRDIEVADARNLRTGRRSVLETIIAEAEDRVVRWHTGLLLLADKKDYLLLEVRRGRLRGSRRFDAAGLAAFRNDQFEYFCLTEEYEALRAAAQKEFELKEQEARRKDAGRGYRSFDEGAFNERVRASILMHSREILAD